MVDIFKAENILDNNFTNYVLRRGIVTNKTKQMINPINMKPDEFRKLVRSEIWTDVTIEACQGYTQANIAILPNEYSYDFLLFCVRSPQPCPILAVADDGDPFPKSLSAESDIRTDIKKYRVFKNGKVVDESYNVIKYWRNDQAMSFGDQDSLYDYSLSSS